MTTRVHRPEYDPTTDPLNEQVCRNEDRLVQRDPEVDAVPQVVKAFNGREPGIRNVPWPAEVEAHHR
jgi:hypothetical protein